MLIKGSKVHINRELREGVSKGQTFVVGRTEALRDPDTGELLDVSMEKAGTIVIESVKDKVAIGIVTEGAAKIKKGMTVMPPE